MKLAGNMKNRKMETRRGDRTNQRPSLRRVLKRTPIRHWNCLHEYQQVQRVSHDYVCEGGGGPMNDIQDQKYM